MNKEQIKYVKMMKRLSTDWKKYTDIQILRIGLKNLNPLIKKLNAKTK